MVPQGVAAVAEEDDRAVLIEVREVGHRFGGIDNNAFLPQQADHVLLRIVVRDEPRTTHHASVRVECAIRVAMDRHTDGHRGA